MSSILERNELKRPAGILTDVTITRYYPQYLTIRSILMKLWQLPGSH